MLRYKYLIIGGGMTGDSAVQGIREVDNEGSIGLISNEKYPPYNRPPLTKDLWKGGELDKIWRGTERLNINLHLSTHIARLDTESKYAVDDKGNKYEFEKLLLATGGRPIKFPFGNEDIIYYRHLSDYENLHKAAESKNSFAVIGGGFIGSEIAAALSMNGKDVTMIFPEKYIGERIYPLDLAEYITNFYSEKGVTLITGEAVTEIEKLNEIFSIRTGSGKRVKADCVIAGLGIRPNTLLAESSGIAVNNGILVDEHLRTNISYIYAAGDAANFYNPSLERRIRIEHADNADKMGKSAGRFMAGDNGVFDYLPFFYSDMFELGYEAIGELYSTYDIINDWQEPFKKGVIYYLQNNKVRGVLLWNVWGKVKDARELIGSKKSYKPEELKGLIK
jgi:3-phenylpropionate/trans-cinnamate dioxygenase ferredoxin reductase subunit